MRICITLPKQQLDYLKRLSMHMGISQGAIVRMALSDLFSNYLLEDNQKKKSKI